MTYTKLLQEKHEDAKMRGYEDLQIFPHFRLHFPRPRASIMQPQPDSSLTNPSLHDPSVPYVHEYTGHPMSDLEYLSTRKMMLRKNKRYYGIG
jgi:hypothetical protein